MVCSKKRIELMHELFGIDEEHQCKTCCHIERHSMSRSYYKCIAYGDTPSEASDWRLKWTACGLYNKPLEGDVPIIELKKHMPKPITETQCEGQMNLWEI